MALGLPTEGLGGEEEAAAPQPWKRRMQMRRSGAGLKPEDDVAGDPQSAPVLATASVNTPDVAQEPGTSLHSEAMVGGQSSLASEKEAVAAEEAAQPDKMRAALQALRTRRIALDAAQADLEAERAEKEKLEDQLRQVRMDLATEKASVTFLAATISTQRTELSSVRAELEQARRAEASSLESAGALQPQLDVALVQVKELRRELTALQQLRGGSGSPQAPSDAQMQPASVFEGGAAVPPRSVFERREARLPSPPVGGEQEESDDVWRKAEEEWKADVHSSEPEALRRGHKRAAEEQLPPPRSAQGALP